LGLTQHPISYSIRPIPLSHTSKWIPMSCCSNKEEAG
jgi:hypothetical protein